MKKLTSLVLALMMLLTCAASLTAFAEGADTEADNNASITVNAPLSHYATNNGEEGAEDSDTPSVNTEIWLQVDASGQIDVTVPLVLVFKTNIDGGYATSPETYKMINNSTADLAVTSIKVTVEEPTAQQPMVLVEEGEEVGTDTYSLKLHVDATEKDDDEHRLAHVAYDGDMSKFTADADTADVKDGGLFQIYKDGGETRIIATMKTSPLSFTTLRKDGENGSELDETKGVKIITITYTVGIDAQGAIGEAITTTSEQFKAPTGDETVGE